MSRPSRKHPGLLFGESKVAAVARAVLNGLFAPMVDEPGSRAARNVHVFPLAGTLGWGLLAESYEQIEARPGVNCHRTSAWVVRPVQHEALLVEIELHSWDAGTEATITGDRHWLEVPRRRMYAERDRRTAAVGEELDTITVRSVPFDAVPAMGARLSSDQVRRYAERPRAAWAEAESLASTDTAPAYGSEKNVVGVAAPSWEGFRERLARVLGKMAVDTFLIICGPSPEPGRDYFVQFAQGGRAGFLAEAVSNVNLEGLSALSPTQDELMGDLGWMSPTPGSTVEPNYSRQWPMPVPFEEAAHLAVRTLREVFGITATSQLYYKSFAENGPEFARPELGIRADIAPSPKGESHRAMPTTDEVRALVESAVKQFLNTEEVKHDADGDIPIRMGSATVFARVIDGQPPLVQVFSPVAWGIPASAELLEAVNDINLRIKFGKVVWTGREVMAGMALSAARVSAEDIGFACLQVGSIADHFDDELKARFGGTTMFGSGSGLVN
jgi:hypothetical protein